MNVSGIKLGAPRMKNDNILVDASYTATAFRFVPQKSDEKKDAKKDGNK